MFNNKRKRKLVKPKPDVKFWAFEFRNSNPESEEERIEKEKKDSERKESEKKERIERNKKSYDDKRGKASMDFSYLYECHSMKDSVNRISPEDMKIFCENVVMKII